MHWRRCSIFKLTSYGSHGEVSLSSYFDSCANFKDAIVAIIATLAKQERIRISELTRAGLAHVKASGKMLGRPRRLNGEHRAQIDTLKSQDISGSKTCDRYSYPDLISIAMSKDGSSSLLTNGWILYFVRRIGAINVNEAFRASLPYTPPASRRASLEVFRVNPIRPAVSELGTSQGDQ